MTMREDMPALVPPSVADERGRAFGRMMARAAADPQFSGLLFERIDTVDASVLPFLVREFSIEEFVEPGMSEGVIRALLKASYELHASKGFIQGVRRGLLMLGMRVVWKQWFQQVPKAAPGTHIATVFVNQTIFDGQSALLDERVQRAARRMIDGMKRHSQDVAFQLAIAIQARGGTAMAMLSAHVIRSAADASPASRVAATAGAAGITQALAVATSIGTASPLRRLGTTVGAAAAARSLSIVNARMEAA